jgi:O-antigen/teichoic acid export membrane protein
VSDLKKDIAFTFSGNLTGTIIGCLVAILLARALGPANRGIVGLAILLPDILSKVFSLGYEVVNPTYAGLYKEHRSALFQHSALIALFSGIFCSILICLFYYWLPVDKGRFEQVPLETVPFLCLIVPLSMMVRLLISLLRGVEKTDRAAIVFVIQNFFLFLSLVVALLFFDRTVKTVIIVWSLSFLIPISIGLWQLRPYVTFDPSHFSLPLFRKGLWFGGQLSLTTVARLLNYRFDQAMLAFMVPIEQVGLYVVAVGFAERLRILPQSIAAAFLPRLTNELQQRQSQVPQVYRYTVLISFFSMLMTAILGVPAVYMLFGKEYAGSIASFLWLLPGIAVLGGSSILSSDILAREKAKYSLITGYITLTLNVILNLVLIPRLGIAGAAIASSLSYSFAGLLWIIFYLLESSTSLRELVPGSQDAAFLYRRAKEFLFQQVRKQR